MSSHTEISYFSFFDRAVAEDASPARNAEMLSHRWKLNQNSIRVTVKAGKRGDWEIETVFKMTFGHVKLCNRKFSMVQQYTLARSDHSDTSQNIFGLF